jgi:hypothetical protein
MSKPRSCPHCQKPIPLDHGFFYDEAGNLHCGACQKVAFAVAESAETTTTYNSNYTGYGYTTNNHQPSNFRGTDSFPAGRGSIVAEE